MKWIFLGGGWVFSAPGVQGPRSQGRGERSRNSPPCASCFPVFPMAGLGKLPKFHPGRDLGLRGLSPTVLFLPHPPQLYNSGSSREFNLVSKKETSRKSIFVLKTTTATFSAWRKEKKPVKNPHFIHREAADLEQKKPAWIYFKVSTTIRTT